MGRGLAVQARGCEFSPRTWNLSVGETEAGGSWGITGVRPASGKGVASKAEDQSLIPGTHVVEGEN